MPIMYFWPYSWDCTTAWAIIRHSRRGLKNNVSQISHYKKGVTVASYVRTYPEARWFGKSPRTYGKHSEACWFGKFPSSFGNYSDACWLGNYRQPQSHLRVASTPPSASRLYERVDGDIDLWLFEKSMFFEVVNEIYLSYSQLSYWMGYNSCTPFWSIHENVLRDISWLTKGEGNNYYMYVCICYITFWKDT